MVYRHERDEGWSVSGYLTLLQQQNSLTPRDIYWRFVWEKGGREGERKRGRKGGRRQTERERGEREGEKERQVIPVCLPRLWGVINWLRCSACGQPFQCCDISSCHYHPQPTLAGRPSTGPPVHICCGSLPEDLSPFPLPQVRKMSRVEFLFYCVIYIHGLFTEWVLC